MRPVVSKDRAKQLIAELRLNLQDGPAYSPKDASFCVFKAEAGQVTGKLSSEGENAEGQKVDENPSFRMLSSAMVQKVYDFTEINFESKVPLFSNVKLMKDHGRSVDSIIGRTGVAFYSKANGDIPAGVNAPVFIDEEFAPALKKKVEKGLIDSGSVGIEFTSEPSHEFEDPWDFYWLLGTEIDGEMVRFVVTDILKIQEFSLVWEGADPYAKKMAKSSETTLLALSDATKKVQSLEEEVKLSLKEKDDLVVRLEKMQEALKLSEAEIEKFHAEMISSCAEFATVAEAVKFARLGKVLLEELRQNTILAMTRSIAAGNKPSASLQNLILGLEDVEQLKDLQKMFQSKLEELPKGQRSKMVECTLDAVTSPINLKPVTTSIDKE